MKTYHDIKGDGGSDVVGQVTEQIGRLNARMASVRHIVAVTSGKGGVGKSALTANLAAQLAADGKSVGIMDADINGSSIPKMLGIRGAALKKKADGVLPAQGNLGIRVMSIDFFLNDDAVPVVWDATVPQDAFTWRGMMEMGALREMLTDTVWGPLDYLFIDVPPGTDKLSNITDILPQLSGALIISIPSGVSQFVVGKSMYLAKQLLKTRVIGVIENMATYICPSCGTEEILFPGDGLKDLVLTYGMPYLGKIPLDPRLARASDEGASLVVDQPGLPVVGAIREMAVKVEDFLNP